MKKKSRAVADCVDTLTAKFYARNARSRAMAYEQAEQSDIHALIQSLVDPDAAILDIGAGSGRDAAMLAAAGCRVTITDGCPEMLAEALRLHPELADSARLAVFPLNPEDPLLCLRFDLVLCSGLIMHLTDGELALLAGQMVRMINPGGTLLLSHSNGREKFEGARDEYGRLMIERNGDEIIHLMTSNGFTQKNQLRTADGMGRSGLYWITHVFCKRAGY